MGEATDIVAVAPAGGSGILFLFFFGALAIFLIAWSGYWWPSRFRAHSPRSRIGWIKRLVIATLTLTLAIVFPPRRRAADWRDPAMGQPIPIEFSSEFDRFLFGYIPSYGFLGTIGREQAYECSVKLDDRGPYRCQSFRWSAIGSLLQWS